MRAKGEVSGGLVGSRAVVLAFLRVVDAAETDAFSVVIVENVDCVAVNYSDDSAGEVGS